MLLGCQTTEFHMCEYYLSAHCVVQHWLRLSDRLFISQATPFADEVCETNRLLGRRGGVVERKTRKSFSALFAAISQVSPPSNGANWRMRKKVIRTNRPAATALNKVSLKSTVIDNHAVLNTEWQY